MRKMLIAASLIAIAAPAAAQGNDAPPAAPAYDETLSDLPPQAEIEAMGETIGRVAEALMDVEIGPIIDAVDPGRPLSRAQRERTLGDLAADGDPHARERMRESIAATSVGLGAAMSQIAALAPVLWESIERAERDIEDAMERGRHPETGERE